MLAIRSEADAIDRGKPVLICGLASVAVGALVALVPSLTASGGPYWSDGFQLIAYMIGAVMAASVLGLVFGVPRAREDDGGPTTERFLANSNLEQISDWLTKVLVGAGLVQLGALAGGLKSLGDYLGSGLRLRNSEALAVAVTIYGLAIGFTFTYLWSRVRLRVVLEESERQAREQSKEEKAADALLQANATSEQPVPPEVVTSIVSAAVKRTEPTTIPRRPRCVLWVDDYPANNTATAEALRHLGIRVDVARSTAEARRRLDERAYGTVITDLGRREDGVEKADAGLELLAAVREHYPDLPIIVYAGRRAMERKSEIEGAGAVLSTNNPSELFERTVELLT